MLYYAGPSHMSLYLMPHRGASLSTWSFGDGTPQFDLSGEYFIFYSHGLDAPTWTFWFEIQVLQDFVSGEWDYSCSNVSAWCELSPLPPPFFTFLTFLNSCQTLPQSFISLCLQEISSCQRTSGLCFMCSCHVKTSLKRLHDPFLKQSSIKNPLSW